MEPQDLTNEQLGMAYDFVAIKWLDLHYDDPSYEAIYQLKEDLRTEIKSRIDLLKP